MAPLREVHLNSVIHQCLSCDDTENKNWTLDGTTKLEGQNIANLRHNMCLRKPLALA